MIIIRHVWFCVTFKNLFRYSEAWTKLFRVICETKGCDIVNYFGKLFYSLVIKNYHNKYHKYHKEGRKATYEKTLVTNKITCAFTISFLGDMYFHEEAILSNFLQLPILHLEMKSTSSHFVNQLPFGNVLVSSDALNFTLFNEELGLNYKYIISK